MFLNKYFQNTNKPLENLSGFFQTICNISLEKLSNQKINSVMPSQNLSDEERKERGKEMMKKNFKSEKEIAETKGLKEFD